MNEYPIMFSTSMVEAIQQGRKSQTRRVLKSTLPEDAYGIKVWHAPEIPVDLKAEEGIYYWCKSGLRRLPELPYGLPGDRLWVRETFMPLTLGYAYKADKVFIEGHPAVKWKPSIYMPREAARIILEVTAIRVERLNDIYEHQAKSEGVEFIITDDEAKKRQYRNYLTTSPLLSFEFHKAKESFKTLWESIHGKKHTWESNPYVWVIEFKKI